MSTNLEEEIKELIIDALLLEDISVADIGSEQALFVNGLGLDSIDALELAIALEKRFGVQIKGSDDDKRRIFWSVRSLAEHVNEHQRGCVR